MRNIPRRANRDGDEEPFKPLQTCTRCGAPLPDDIEVCRHCGRWRHGRTLLIAGIVGFVVSMLTAWFVFSGTF